MNRLSVLFWNVEHFNGKGGMDSNNQEGRKNRVTDVIKLIKKAEVDIFGLSEVESGDVYDRITAEFPNYTFHVTEGRQSQEILIGVRSEFTAFFTQRTEFKRSNPYLRPGALLTLRKGDIHIPILFIHLKSTSSPEGFGLRDAMFDKVMELKRALDKKAEMANAGSSANLIVVGDMNTMGMDYAGQEHDISESEEIKQMTSSFGKLKLKARSKSHRYTFNNGSKSKFKPAELDHVFAAEHLEFVRDSNDAEVEVLGWAKKGSKSEQDEWIERYSDHAPLLFTLCTP